MSNDDAVVPPTARSTPDIREIRCEYCQCRLARSGHVLEMSDRARTLREAEDDLIAARKALTIANGELERVRGELDIARAALAPKQRAGLITIE